jgi:hypothetical protein
MKRLTSLKPMFALLSLAVIGLTIAPNLAQAGVNVDGVLSRSTPISQVYRPGCHHRIVDVTLYAGTTYTIDLASDDFDSYLLLLDRNGNILAEDDDSGGGLDARIVYRPRVSGTYQIVVTTYRAGERGAYSLTVRP